MTTTLTLPIQIGRRYVRRDGRVVTAREPHPDVGPGFAYVGDDEPEGLTTIVLLSSGLGVCTPFDIDLVADAEAGGSPEPTEHQYAEVLRAIADGHRIQMQTEDGEWLRAPVDTNIVLLKVVKGTTPPSRFRIEQKPKICRYRVAEMRIRGGPTYTVTRDSEFDAEAILEHPCFVRWLTDWIEYEVTE